MALILILTNVSNLAPVSDYNYEVLVGDGSPERSKVLEQGFIGSHERAEGWRALVQRVLTDDIIDDGKIPDA